MELRHLRYFKAIADYGSLTAAAKRLRVSQSSISEQILDLESEIGATLLNRSGRKARLTAEGQVFLVEARKTLESAQRAVDLTRQAMQGEAGTLAVGFFLQGAAGFFPRIIREYRKRRPGIRLSLWDMQAREQLEALEDGRIDVGLTRPLQAPHGRRLKSEMLYRDPIVVAMPADHRLAKGPVTVEALKDEAMVMYERESNPWLFDGVVGLCASRGFSPRTVNESATYSGVLTLVEAGEGVALVPAGVRHLRAKGLAFRELEGSELSLGVVAAWNPMNEGVALREFLELLRENKGKIERSGGN
ncbi:MAG: LysR substrate-binding domain-containing protein [Acidobacteriota bacterium]